VSFLSPKIGFDQSPSKPIKILKFQKPYVEKMKPVVLYSTQSGNTRKIADAIASELKCESLNVNQSNLAQTKDLNDFDLIFVGTGIRFGNPNEDLINYLNATVLGQPKTFALFLTWGEAGKTDQKAISKLKRVLESKSQRIVDDYFTCYGGRKFSLLKRKHPNAEDNAAAVHWAKEIVKKIK
jgi:menaquinone-dependent protoporphyrinogen IX oxidase